MLKLKSWSRGAAAGTIALLLMAGTPAQAADNPQVAAEIMALARAQWASEIAGEPMAQQNAQLADDYTEFNGDFPTLLVGKAMSTRIGEVTPYDKAMFSDMQNGRVQVYGDTAILTYNFAGLRRGADAKVNPSLAKSTRVYVRQGGQWRLVHANFAPVAAGH
jgi:ketosteroid isomerase-like protein